MSDSVGTFLLGAGAGILASAIAVLAWTRLRHRGARSPDAGRRADLATNIAHELKNPIMAIKGLASTGTRLYESMSDEERLEFFRLIHAEATRLKLVADETSTALKIEAGRLTYDLRPEDLGKLVQEVAWRTPVGEHAMVVEVEDASPCPSIEPGSRRCLRT